METINWDTFVRRCSLLIFGPNEVTLGSIVHGRDESARRVSEWFRYRMIGARFNSVAEGGYRLPTFYVAASTRCNLIDSPRVSRRRDAFRSCERYV